MNSRSGPSEACASPGGRVDHAWRFVELKRGLAVDVDEGRWREPEATAVSTNARELIGPGLGQRACDGAFASATRGVEIVDVEVRTSGRTTG